MACYGPKRRLKRVKIYGRKTPVLLILKSKNNPKTTTNMATKRKSRKSNKGTAKLKKIVAEAKKIYKGGKSGVKWTTAISRAAKRI